MKSSSLLLVALLTALASTTPAPNGVCIPNGGDCRLVKHCCPDTECVHAAENILLPWRCRRRCTEEMTVCKVDVDCCVGNICKDDPDFGKFCMPNHPPSECTKVGLSCKDDNECCGDDTTRCGRAKNNWDPLLCMEISCKTSGQACSTDSCCPGLACSEDGVNNGVPRCITR